MCAAFTCRFLAHPNIAILSSNVVARHFSPIMNIVTAFFFFHWRQRLCKAVCLNWTLSVMTKATARKKRALLKVDFLWSPSRLLTSISFSPFLLCYSLSHIYNAASSFFFSSVLVARVLFSDIRSCCCAPCKTHTHKYTRHEKKKWKPEVF